LGWSVHHLIATLGFIFQNRAWCSYKIVVSDGSGEDVMPLAANNLLLWVLKWPQEGSAKDGKPQVHPR
jgi:hypothetical protein